MTHDRTTTSHEDRERALDLAALEMLECERLSRQIYGADHVNICSYPDKADWPAGDCADTAMMVIIGIRGNLTKSHARKSAAMWRDVIARYPKALLYISILGYAADPRELWEFPDVCRYVRQWRASPAWTTPRSQTVASVWNRRCAPCPISPPQAWAFSPPAAASAKRCGSTRCATIVPPRNISPRGDAT